jgi:hypothetical protein
MIERVTSGVDWLTATLPIEANASADWYGRALRYLQYVGKQGYEIKNRTMLGYEGLSCGNCFVGAREADYMCQWTGFHADDGFDAVYRPDLHISRIDVEVTVQMEPMDTNIGRKAYSDAKAANELLPATRRRKLFIIIGSDGGDTFYLGSPSSDQRGRIYNKEVQSEDPLYTRCWRYEVVFRNNHATSIAGHIYPHIRDKAGICSDIVAKWLQNRGCDTSWHNNTEALPLPLVRTLPTDIERKVHWLDTQVRPTVRALCDLGFRDIVLASLGLSEQI